MKVIPSRIELDLSYILDLSLIFYHIHSYGALLLQLLHFMLNLAAYKNIKMHVYHIGTIYSKARCSHPDGSIDAQHKPLMASDRLNYAYVFTKTKDL